MIQIDKSYTNYHGINSTGDRLHIFGAVVEGWILVDENLSDLVIQVGEVVIAQAKTGLPRPDIGVLYPALVNSDHCGFSAVIKHAAFLINQPTEITVVAKTVSGKTIMTTALIELMNDDSTIFETENAQLGTTIDSESHDFAPAPPTTGETIQPPSGQLYHSEPLLIHLERAEIHPSGLLEVIGWAVSITPLICIRIHFGNEYLGDAQLGIDRPDVYDAHPNYPNSLNAGFSFTGKFTGYTLPSNCLIRVEAISKGNIVCSSAMALASPQAKIIALTMVYNEGRRMERWLDYYGQHLGYENLLILDHGCTDGSTLNLGAAGRLRLPRETFDDGQRAKFISDLQRDLFTYFDVVIYTDCDEFIVPDPRYYQGLRDYVNRMAVDNIRAVGLDMFHARNIEPELDESRPILEQRKYCIFKSGLCKPLISKTPLKWDPGFHACDKRVPIDPNLYLFHIKNVDYRNSLQRLEITRNISWSDRSFIAKWGHHHRLSDSEWTKYAFDTPENKLRLELCESFVFEETANQFFESMELAGGIWHVKPFLGSVFCIPDWLRHAF